MRTKLLSEHPGLIGELLRRHEARERRKFKARNNAPWWFTFAFTVIFGTLFSYIIHWLFRL